MIRPTRQQRVGSIPQLEEDLAIIAQHKENIQTASSQAADLISEAATRASKVLADAATVALKVVNQKDAEDHDLLIRLETGMSFVRQDIRDLATGVTGRILELEKNKADKKDLDILEKNKADQKELNELEKNFKCLSDEIHIEREKRMRNLEFNVSRFLIIMGIILAGVGSLFIMFFTHINN